MSLFKHAMVSGINDGLVDRGIVSWPNEAVGFEICEKFASNLEGPDMLPEGGLSKESALMIATGLKEASDALAANGYRADAGMVLRTKQAAAMDFETRAAIMSEACMTKAAEAASLTEVGPNTAESAATDEQVAALDQKNRPANKYLTGVGRTMFPSGGVVGQQMVHPERQAGPMIANSLTALDKQAADGEEAGRLARMMASLRGHGADVMEAAKAPFLPGARGDYALMAADPEGYGISGKLDALKHTIGPGIKELAHDRRAQAAAALAALTASAYGGKKLYDRYSADDEMPKAASEDMAASDLAAADMTPGPTPGALMRAMMFLRGLRNKGVDPGAEAQVAAAGLGEAGAPGMEVMAHVLDTVKTAEEADDIIEQILARQGEVGELASPELVEAIQQMMDDEDEAEKSAALSDIRDYVKMKGKSTYKDIADTVGEAAAKKTMEGHRQGAMKTLGRGALAVGGTAAAAYGGKKLYDKMKAKKEEKSEASEPKAASLLAYLKAAADGSLTNVPENTPESAAHDEQVAQLDQANRSTSEYLIGQGGMSRLPNKGQVYAVEPAPKHDDVATDTVASREVKSAEEAAYVQNFRKIASELGPYLPATMPRATKVAHLQAMLGMPPSERGAYLKALRVG